MQRASSVPNPPPSEAGTLAGNVIVITGAGSGIGRATALRTAALGADVVLVGRNRGPLDATGVACARHGARFVSVACDITEASAPARIASATLDAFGRVDSVVNNAALARFAPLDRLADDDARRMFETNLLAPWRLTRALLDGLRRSRGVVVNVSSIGGVRATPNRALYGALKAGLNHLTRSLALELAPAVRVNAVVPGAVDTPMYQDLGLDGSAVAELRLDMLRTTPLQRLGEADEIAAWVCHLLVPSAAWVTGSLLVIDGGRSA